MHIPHKVIMANWGLKNNIFYIAVIYLKTKNEFMPPRGATVYITRYPTWFIGLESRRELEIIKNLLDPIAKNT